MKRLACASLHISLQVEKIKAKDETHSEAETRKIVEEEISPNEYFKLRSAAVEALKSDPATHPYPHKFHVSISLTDFIENYNSLEQGTTLTD